LTPVERKVLEVALWAPGEVENRLKQGRTALDGQEWWAAKAEK
jgi:hypothetical protein